MGRVWRRHPPRLLRRRCGLGQQARARTHALFAASARPPAARPSLHALRSPALCLRWSWLCRVPVPATAARSGRWRVRPPRPGAARPGGVRAAGRPGEPAALAAPSLPLPPGWPHARAVRTDLAPTLCRLGVAAPAPNPAAARLRPPSVWAPPHPAPSGEGGAPEAVSCLGRPLDARVLYACVRACVRRYDISIHEG